MKLITRLILLGCCGVFLLGCSNVIQSRDKEYLAAKSIPPLRIPPGISSSAFQTTYPVSDRSYPRNMTDVNMVPPGLVQKS